MRGLPAHHVGRPRLTSACEGHRIVVVEAAGGFGKSVFAAELVDAWGVVGIDVVLHDGGVPPSVFVARLRAAMAAAGFTAAAEDAAAAPDDPVGAIDVMLEALRDESCAIVVDDAHHAGRETGVLIDRIASTLRGDQRLVVLARRLPEGAERMRRADSLQLTASDLALLPDETLQLCRNGFGLDVAADAAAAIDRATGGWTAAAVLAAARAKRTGESVLELAEQTSDAARQGAVAAILDEAVSAMGPVGRVGLAQLARLPLLNREVVDGALGEGFFDRALAVGVPLSPGDDGWWELAGPVREFLETLGPPDASSMRRAAAYYRDQGRLTAALDLLIASGDDRSAAELLTTGDLGAIDQLDVREYRAAVARLSERAVESTPMVLVLLARFLDAAGLFDEKAEVLDRLEKIARAADDPAISRALEAERTWDLIRVTRFAEAEERARALLADTPRDDALTRARALSCLGRCLCWHFDPEGRRDAAALREADARLEEAEEQYERLGMRAASAGMVPYRAIWIEFASGDAERAMRRLDEAAGRILDRPRRWAYLQNLRAEVAIELGRYDEAWLAIREILRVADQLGDGQLVAYAHWNAMAAASHAGDAAATVEHMRVVEANKGDWWPAAGPDFHATATDDLARVGEIALADAHLAEAKANPGDAGHLVAMGEASLLARHGDPELAEAALLAAPGAGVDPREYWRVDLLRAYAAFRRGDPSAGPLAARAFEESARLRLANVPLTKERAITEALLGLAVETGQPAALALQVAALPVTISVLGRFELARGGRRVGLSASIGTQLLKLVVVQGGRVPTERAIEQLWPDSDPEAGRNRLRTVLNRLRAEAGDVLARDGEVLSLADDVVVDLAQFAGEARRALALGRTEPAAAVSIARSAVARYRGDVLPDDPYEEWAVAPRDRARRDVLELLELCTDVATARGDLDEIRRAVDRAIDLAPDDDRWYVRAAETLVAQGRRGAALAVLRRAQAELERQGFGAPRALLDLELAVRA
jgi:ATP/maltotriose-dependent transcriptional regulator MalT/DNA-binding SARP family transcriptional activator